MMSIKEIKRRYAEQAKAKKKSSTDEDEELLNEAAARREDEPPLTELEKEMRRRKVRNRIQLGAPNENKILLLPRARGTRPCLTSAHVA